MREEQFSNLNLHTQTQNSDSGNLIAVGPTELG